MGDSVPKVPVTNVPIPGVDGPQKVPEAPSVNSVPTQFFQLPSRGLLYPKDHPLRKSAGKLELRYITAAEEDIITNEHYLEEGIVFDKLVSSVIVDKAINFLDLLVADFNSLLYPLKVLSYGPKASFRYDGHDYEIDISKFDHKELFESDYVNGNSFELHLPNSGNDITFKLPTVGDEKVINKEIESLQKKDPKAKFSNVATFNQVITSINGSSDVRDIRGFVRTLLSADARIIRSRMVELAPRVLADFTDKDGRRVAVPSDAFLILPNNSF